MAHLDGSTTMEDQDKVRFAALSRILATTPTLLTVHAPSTPASVHHTHARGPFPSVRGLSNRTLDSPEITMRINFDDDDDQDHGHDHAERSLDLSHPNPRPQGLYTLIHRTKMSYWDYIYLVPAAEYLHVKNKTSSHAVAAFCVKCDVLLKYKKGSTYDISRHVNKHHPNEAGTQTAASTGQQEATLKPPLLDPVRMMADSDGSRKRPQGLRPLTKTQQATLRRLLAMWLASSQRPHDLVTDDGFGDVMNYLASCGGLQVRVGSREMITKEMKKVAQELRGVLTARILADADFYTITTDIWTDRAVRSFISLTIHYLEVDFSFNSWTLEVKPFTGQHKGGLIKNELESTMREWKLNKTKCVRLVRDGASNAKSAAEKLGVDHFSCFAHALHLVVAGAMVRRQGKVALKGVLAALETESAEAAASTQPTLAEPAVEGASVLGSSAAESSTNADVEGNVRILQDRACTEVDEFQPETMNATDMHHMNNMRTTVQVFRDLGVYFNKSAKGRFRIACLRAQHDPEHHFGFDTDCPTRWNSTYSMLMRFVLLEKTLREFVKYRTTDPDGLEEFGGVSFRFPREDEWASVKCLLQLLEPFAVMTEDLEYSNHPTLTLAAPLMKCIKRDLDNKNLFDTELRQWEHEEFYDNLCTRVDGLRTAMRKLYHNRFLNLDKDFTWIPFLDPRVSQMRHLTTTEKRNARATFLEKVIEVASRDLQLESQHTEDHDTIRPRVTPRKTCQRYYSLVYNGEPGDFDDADESDDSEDQLETIRDRCDQEISSYIKATKSKNTDALEWWRTNGYRFLNVAILARRWLSCVATSAPSERAFSTAGNVSPPNDAL